MYLSLVLLVTDSSVVLLRIQWTDFRVFLRALHHGTEWTKTGLNVLVDCKQSKCAYMYVNVNMMKGVNLG